MIYTDLTRAAIKLAFEAHKNQVDKAGMPYIHHPLHLAEQMTDEATICVALLHDVIEDSDMTLAELCSYGFNDEIIAALRLLTHDKSVPYTDYVAAIKRNPIARQVKLADLAHNSDLTRLPEPMRDERALERCAKYHAAIEFLLEN